MSLAPVPPITPALTLKPTSRMLALLVAAAHREIAEAEWRLVSRHMGVPTPPGEAGTAALPQTAARPADPATLDRRA